jgi:hypothetical protein
MEQQLLSLPEHLSSPPGFSGVRVTRSLVLFVLFCRSLFGLLYFFIWPLFYLLFSDLRILITLLVSSNSSVFLLFTVSDYPFAIFKLFCLSSIYSFWLPFWYLHTLLSFSEKSPFGVSRVEWYSDHQWLHVQMGCIEMEKDRRVWRYQKGNQKL